MFKRKAELGEQMVANLRGGPGEILKLNWPETMPLHVSLASQLVLKPGVGIGYHTHDKETEIFCILSGALEVDDNGTVYTAYPGDLMFTGNGQGHSVLNKSSEDATLFAVIIKED